MTSTRESLTVTTPLILAIQMDAASSARSANHDYYNMCIPYSLEACAIRKPDSANHLTDLEVNQDSLLCLSDQLLPSHARPEYSSVARNTDLLASNLELWLLLALHRPQLRHKPTNKHPAALQPLPTASLRSTSRTPASRLRQAWSCPSSRKLPLALFSTYDWHPKSPSHSFKLLVPRLPSSAHIHRTSQLFEGHPTLPKFSLWAQNATFTDNITVATGYPKYTAQFYGLPALFKPIQLQHHRVTSAGNPIELEMSNKYVVKGIKKEQIMNSVVRIFVGQDGKIEKVEDRWNGKLPEGAISDVSLTSATSPKIGQMDAGGWTLSPLGAIRWAILMGKGVGWRVFCELSWWSPFLVGGYL